MNDIFFELYQSCELETKASRRARKTLEGLLLEVGDALGAKKAGELQSFAETIREEEGLRSFTEGFRFGMAAISEQL